MTFQFQKATKRESKARVAIAGVSGSGKTWTALSLARAMGGKVALIDTEHGSASKYADLYEFDTLILEPPYDPDRYIEAMDAAAQAGYDILVIDSLSHAWAGSGGLLEFVDDASTRYKGNTYFAWREATPKQLALVEAILASPMHIIGTLRSKARYILDEKDGKTAPRKVGMEAVQREGFEFEFDVYGEMDLDHKLVISKSRCTPLADAVISRPTGADIASLLMPWLEGEPAPHWMTAEAKSKALGWLEQFGLDEDSACDLLGLDALEQYPGSKDQFKREVERAVKERKAGTR